MPTTTRKPVLISHAVTLLLGAVLAVAIGLAGYVELSWLGFAAAAMRSDNDPCSGPWARPLRRSTR